MIDNLLSRLDKVRRVKDGQYTACCPSHDDKNPSLAVSELPDGRILVHCYAGCDTGSIMSAVGLSLSDLFPDGAINHRLHGATPWLRKNQLKQESRLENERLILAMADADRAAGKRLSQSDLERERLAFIRVRGG